MLVRSLTLLSTVRAETVSHWNSGQQRSQKITVTEGHITCEYITHNFQFLNHHPVSQSHYNVHLPGGSDFNDNMMFVYIHHLQFHPWEQIKNNTTPSPKGR